MIIMRTVIRIAIKMCLIPHQLYLLHCPPEKQSVLPRAVETEKQHKLFMLQTTYFDSPNHSTSNFWQDRDSWLKNNEEKPPGMRELLYLESGASRGRGRVSSAELSAQWRKPPHFPISIQRQSLCRDCERAPGQPP